MDPSVLRLITTINKVLFAWVLILSAGIFLNAALRESARKRHQRSYDRIREGLSLVQELDPAAAEAECLRLIRKAPVSVLIRLIRHQKEWMSGNLAEIFSGCLKKSEKMKRIERRAEKDLRKWKRIEALSCLGYAATPRSLGILREAMKNRDEDISYYAELALSHVKSKDAFALLLEQMEARPARAQKIASLLEDFPENTSETLAAALRRPDTKTCFWALKLLSRFQRPEIVSAVSALTRHPAPDLRAAACECLGNIGNPASAPRLLECLQDDAWFVRMHAVRALEKVSGTQYLDVIAALLETDPSLAVKESIKNILCRNIGEALSRLEPCILGSAAAGTRRYCIAAVAEADYTRVLLANLLGNNALEKSRSARLLPAMIRSGVYFGLKPALDSFETRQRGQLVDWIASVDPDLAGKVAGPAVSGGRR